MDVGSPTQPGSTPVFRTRYKIDFVPIVEWWDANFLKHRSYDDVVMDKFEIPEDKITHYVEHPVPVRPANEPTEVVMPLMLTAKEKKKLRTRNRMEKQREMQDKIRIGLLPAPAAKVKLSNLMRVLGEQAIQDPTQIEAEVRSQMAQRQANHDARNAERKLTAEQKRDKKRKKLLEDQSSGCHVNVFRVNDLADPRKKFKIDITAQENILSGIVLVTAALNLIVVEGGPKAVRRFKKLVLRRIKWSGGTDEEIEDDDEDEKLKGIETNIDDIKASKKNECVLVWEGIVKHSNFRNFRVETHPNAASARSALQMRGVEHYWDMAIAQMNAEIVDPDSTLTVTKTF